MLTSSPEFTDAVVPSVLPSLAASPPGAGSSGSVLDCMLDAALDAPSPGSMFEASIGAWSGRSGSLGCGTPAQRGFSCLVEPRVGDRVVAWCGHLGERWVLAVLDRPGDDLDCTLSTPGTMRLESPRIAVVARAFQVHARDFVSSVRHRHAVEHIRTETVKTRVASVGTDVRRATHASDQVDGTAVQRTGTWLATTVREVRMHARAFLFD